MNRISLLGPAIKAARDAKIPWKVLAKSYGLSITRLKQILRKATGQNVRCPSCGHNFTAKAA